MTPDEDIAPATRGDGESSPAAPQGDDAALDAAIAAMVAESRKAHPAQEAGEPEAVGPEARARKTVTAPEPAVRRKGFLHGIVAGLAGLGRDRTVGAREDGAPTGPTEPESASSLAAAETADAVLRALAGHQSGPEDDAAAAGPTAAATRFQDEPAETSAETSGDSPAAESTSEGKEHFAEDFAEAVPSEEIVAPSPDAPGEPPPGAKPREDVALGKAQTDALDEKSPRVEGHDPAELLTENDAPPPDALEEPPADIQPLEQDAAGEAGTGPALEKPSGAEDVAEAVSLTEVEAQFPSDPEDPGWGDRPWEEDTPGEAETEGCEADARAAEGDTEAELLAETAAPAPGTPEGPPGDTHPWDDTAAGAAGPETDEDYARDAEGAAEAVPLAEIEALTPDAPEEPPADARPWEEDAADVAAEPVPSGPIASAGTEETVAMEGRASAPAEAEARAAEISDTGAAEPEPAADGSRDGSIAVSDDADQDGAPGSLPEATAPEPPPDLDSVAEPVEPMAPEPAAGSEKTSDDDRDGDDRRLEEAGAADRAETESPSEFDSPEAGDAEAGQPGHAAAEGTGRAAAGPPEDAEIDEPGHAATEETGSIETERPGDFESESPDHAAAEEAGAEGTDAADSAEALSQAGARGEDQVADLVARTVATAMGETAPAGPHPHGKGAGAAAGNVGIATAAALPFLLALPLVAVGAVLGGGASALALLYLVFISLGPEDLFARTAEAAAGGDDPGEGAEKAGTMLSALHFPMLALALFALGGGTDLSFGAWWAVLAGFALYFGLISMTAAHALIHSTRPKRRRLGLVVYVSLLCGPYARAHRLIHHRFAATPNDPMTAEEGESFWSFASFSWSGGLVAGWEIERVLMKPRLGAKPARVHPYLALIGGGAAFVLGAGIVFGLGAALAYLLLAAILRGGLLIGDYVRHYGMLREIEEEKRFAALMPEHGWEVPEVLPAALRPRRPRLGDHQAHPPGGRRPAAAAGAEVPAGTLPAPTLPWPMPVMAVLALVPPVWHVLMRRHVQAVEWQRLNAADRVARRALGADEP